MSFKIEVETSGPDFDTARMKIPVNCPGCKSRNIVTLGQVQRQETITCINCQRTFKLKDENGTTAKAVHDINNAFYELKRALQDLAS